MGFSVFHRRLSRQKPTRVHWADAGPFGFGMCAGAGIAQMQSLLGLRNHIGGRIVLLGQDGLGGRGQPRKRYRISPKLFAHELGVIICMQVAFFCVSFFLLGVVFVLGAAIFVFRSLHDCLLIEYNARIRCCVIFYLFTGWS